MLKSAVLLLALIGVANAVTVRDCAAFPNGTDTKLNWWPSCTGKIIFNTLAATDADGNAEYPVQLIKPLHVNLGLVNNGAVYCGSAGCKLDTYIWSWGGWTGCDWHSISTLGLLNNLDACTNGVPCPIAQGNQNITVVVDFSKFQAIISLLTDDSPYQLQQIITDNATGDKACVTVQARAKTKN
ncbi:hypothetical protein FO519_000628 [Halicephalobus sp. NKZ332]|nr:hypothetical protein FO519_000628 [Halicephalobus sp. NKZ332]